MSGLPPTLNAETGTPAHEWAQSTTTAAFSREDAAPAVDSYTPPGVQQTMSTVSTPGVDVPGAYPREPSGPINTQAITDAARNAMNTVTSTAQQYLPVAQETATQAAQAAAAAASQATQTAQSYWSGSSAPTGGSTVRASVADDAHQKSLPSTETTGALPQERVGGVGALPGGIQEEAVTKLPDERSVKGNSAIYPSNVNPSTAPSDVLFPASQHSAAVSPLAGAAVPATAAFTALAPSGQQPTHPQDTAVTLRESLPSQESSGQAPYTHQDGVGALPGLKREQGVAVLPDESSPAGATAATSSATGTQSRDWSANPSVPRPGEEAGNESLGAGDRRIGRDAAGGVGSLVGGKGEEGVAVLPDERGAAGRGAPTVAEGGKGDKLGEMDQAEREERHRTAGTQKPEQRQAAQNKRGGEGEGKETQMNLRVANLQPRAHPLGTPDARWRGVGVGASSGYTDGQGVDIGRRPGFDESPKQEGDGYDSNYHPAELHPPPSDAPSTTHDNIQSSGAATKGDATKEGNGEGGRAEGGEKVKKASFMEKMKGEAKVVMGKLEGKKGVEKVQEGKKLKAGEA